MRLFIFWGVLMTFFLTLTGCKQTGDFPKKLPAAEVKAELDKLAPVALDCDLSRLLPADKSALAEILRAAKIIDQLYRLQVSPENPALLKKLQDDRSPASQPYLEMFLVMAGPWNRLQHDAPFLTGTAKPAGAGFYPIDITREEFEAWIAAHPEQKASFESNFTVIQRHGRELVAVPYHTVWHPLIESLTSHLEAAAKSTTDPTLAHFLRLRADGLRKDDYYESDMAWMDLTGDLEVVIGPYEVYEDGLYNYKASYEAFVCLVDHAESRKLEAVGAHLNELEANLPIPDRYKNFKRGGASPVKVVEEIYSAGQSGVQTTAFNLPNDERVREAKGSKKVMLKNIAKAKYESCWMPIVQTVLAPKPLTAVSFEAYFNHVLMHEVSHGLGPGMITLSSGERVDVAKTLKELYSTIEECKADVLGILNMKRLMEKGIFPAEMEYPMYASYLGGMLRSIRFGINEAHGGGVAIQWNYCFDKGAFLQDENGKLTLDETKMLPVLTSLAHELLMFQAIGDYEGAKKFIEMYRKMTPVMQQMVEALKEVPVDIRPSYPVLAQFGL
ncbi:MAG TPA: peptidase [bacterium]|nr:peptidase [bacterium]HQG46175.1 peptidase [bacterium]HQI50147.1 peptidase [bacterium]HQJ65883.1 peptidase [bacterium]